jgi:phosphoserine phosphatase
MNELELLTRLDDIAVARAELAGYYASATTEQLLSHVERCELAPGAEEGFALLRRHGVRTAIVSLTWAFAVEWFARRLGADYWVGTDLSDDGHIEHFWPEDKARWVRDLTRDLELRREQVAAVGDSWGDAEMLQAVGYPFYVGRTLPSDLGAAHYPSGNIAEIARRVVDLRGGYGYDKD